MGRLKSPTTSGDVLRGPPPEALSLPQVEIAGIPALTAFSGLAPGSVGLYQVNVQVPAGGRLALVQRGVAPHGSG